MAYDIVIPLKKSEPNHDLIYTLRALERFGGDYGNVYLVGYCPSYISNVHYIPNDQSRNKWQNTRGNLISACHTSAISDDFVLFNDDFILTKDVIDWEQFTNACCGTLLERGKELLMDKSIRSRWAHGFLFNHSLLSLMGVKSPLDFEYHAPFLYNKRKLLSLFDDERIKPFMTDTKHLLFSRSLYGNLHPRPKPRKIEDVKLREDMTDDAILHQYGFFSVQDGLICSPDAPNLNSWLKATFPEPSRYETNWDVV